MNRGWLNERVELSLSCPLVSKSTVQSSTIWMAAQANISCRSADDPAYHARLSAWSDQQAMSRVIRVHTTVQSEYGPSCLVSCIAVLVPSSPGRHKHACRSNCSAEVVHIAVRAACMSQIRRERMV